MRTVPTIGKALCLLITVLTVGGCGSSKSSGASTKMAAPILTAADSQIGVTWSAVSGATGYEVWLGTLSDPSCAVKFDGSIVDTSCVVDGLTNGTTYYFWIKSISDAATSDFSEMASATPVNLNVPPAAPGAPELAAVGVDVTVTWAAVAGATSYEVWYGTLSDPSSAGKFNGPIVDTSCVVDSLTNGTTYYFWLKAKNDYGTSEFGPVASVVTAAATSTPNAPVITSVISGEHQLTVSWKAVPGATGYKLYYYRSNRSDLASEFNGTFSGTQTQGTITGLEDCVVFYVWVKAFNDNGDSGFSAFPRSGTPALALIPAFIEGTGDVDEDIQSGVHERDHHPFGGEVMWLGHQLETDNRVHRRIFRGFVSFNRRYSSIDGFTVAKLLLNIYTSDISSPLVLEPVEFGSLDAEDYDTAPLGAGISITDYNILLAGENVTSFVQSDVSAKRPLSQFRLRLDNETENKQELYKISLHKMPELCIGK